MKKLMITAAAAMVGIAANAAMCEWSVDTVYESSGSGDAASGYLVYYVDQAINSTTLASELAAANFATLNAAGYEADGLLDGGYTSGSGATYAGDAKTEYGNGYTPYAYLVVLDADTQADAKNFYISPLTEAEEGTSPIGGNAQMPFYDLDGSYSKSGWNAIAAPEPTSGLLLLLGVAGLALRRRRA